MNPEQLALFNPGEFWELQQGPYWYRYRYLGQTIRNNFMLFESVGSPGTSQVFTQSDLGYYLVNNSFRQVADPSDERAIV